MLTTIAKFFILDFCQDTGDATGLLRMNWSDIFSWSNLKIDLGLFIGIYGQLWLTRQFIHEQMRSALLS